MGFFGIMVILNPISMSFDFNMIWPLILACLLAIYSILTRNISTYDNSETSFFWVAIVGAIVMTIIGPFFFECIAARSVHWCEGPVDKEDRDSDESTNKGAIQSI